VTSKAIINIHDHEQSEKLIPKPVLHNKFIYFTFKTATGSIMHDDCDDCGMLSDITLCLGGQESNI